MKRPQIPAGFLMLALIASVSASNCSGQNSFQGKATVRAVHGHVKYSTNNGASWRRVRINREFPSGVKIETGRNSLCDLNVNGSASFVRLEPDTVLSIPIMNRSGRRYDAETETRVNVESGTIEGNVKKLAANSEYDIGTPKGMAAIRGTDFMVEVKEKSRGSTIITYYCISGEFVVSAMIDGQTQVRQLHTGECWTPEYGEVKPIPPGLVPYQIVGPGPPDFFLTPKPPPFEMLPPFPTGTPPQGGSSNPSAPPNIPVSHRR